MTKIDIISGFLGAGKTTLIRKLIEERFKGQKVVLVENEFGEIGIDGGFLKDAGIQISEINSGCICCSLVGDFKKALKQVAETYSPDRIIIEPSGVGKLSDIIRAVEGVDLEGVVLNSFTAVVDGTKCKMYMKNFGEFFNDQVENAHTIIISRTQKMTEAKLEETVALLKRHNPDAVIITTPWDELDGATILTAMEHDSNLLENLMAEAKTARAAAYHHDNDGECSDPDCECHHHHHDDDDDDDECGDPECECHHHHDDDDEECRHEHEECGHHHHHHHGGEHDADDVFTNWGVETPHKYSEAALHGILKTLAGENECGVILRAKGIVSADDGTWLHFDLTPEEYQVRRGSADYTGRICVIGTKLDENQLKKLFGLEQ